MLAANSERVAWRAASHGCDAPATVEVTTDAGRSWQTTDPGIRAIVRLKAFGPESVFAIGADADCKPTYAWIDSPDHEWQLDASNTADKWFRTPGDLSQVQDPAGARSRPCDDGLTDLAGLGTYQAAVLCNDGRIRTRDEGRGWHTIQRHSGAVALNADNTRFVAAIKTRTCAHGLAVLTFDVDGNGLTRHGECREAPATDPDKVAVSNIFTMLWLWSGDKVSVRP